jgi:hypothetical protein
VKVSELSGAVLDYWVALAESWPNLHWSDGSLMTENEWLLNHNVAYGPSQSWACGGPIIEREGIEWERQSSDDGMEIGWTASIQQTAKNPMPPWAWGETQLVAAMRAYVSSKFGEEVPEE